MLSVTRNRWLYGSQNTIARDNLPLVLWLQGGPGGSSSGFGALEPSTAASQRNRAFPGNFGELGPLDVNLQPRNTTWLKAVNLLFVDVRNACPLSPC